jgi:hypothetical protein
MESVKYRIIDKVFQLKPINWPARHVITLLHRIGFGLNRLNRFQTQMTNAIPPSLLPWAKNAEAPDVPYTKLAGVYMHTAYSTLDFCFFFGRTQPPAALVPFL